MSSQSQISADNAVLRKRSEIARLLSQVVGHDYKGKIIERSKVGRQTVGKYFSAAPIRSTSVERISQAIKELLDAAQV